MSDLVPETIETERLLLERLDASGFDALDLYPHYSPRHSETVVEEFAHLSQTPHATPKETLEKLDSAGERWADDDRLVYAVRPTQGEDGAGEFAGVTDLMLDWEKRVGYLALWLRKPFWGRGYSGERAAAMLALAFDRLDLEYVGVGHVEANEKSRRAIERYVERFGGETGAVLRNWIPDDDDPMDLHTYAISREQYRDSVGESPATEAST